MKGKHSRLLSGLLMILSIMLIMPQNATAGVPYGTNSKDAGGQFIWTQPAYYSSTVLGNNLTIEGGEGAGAVQPSPLKGPQDIFIDSNDHLYIADTGNNRIVELQKDGKFVRYLNSKGSPLKGPRGLFVTDAGEIYIADTGNQRIVKLDKDGEFVKEFKRPQSKMIPETYKFDPVRLIVDKRGYLYIVTVGGYQGLLQLDPEGEFQSFYGANRASFSALDAFKKTFFTKKMYERELRKVPGTISSVAVDKDGFIYTTTAGKDVTSNQIKKLNIRGMNMLSGSDSYSSRSNNFGEVLPSAQKKDAGKPVLSQLTDVTIDSHGNMTGIDSVYQYISQYDANGNLLFFWGGPSKSTASQLGLLKSAIAIDSDSNNNLYVLDGQEGLIQKLVPTEFGTYVNEANYLTQQGRYEDSEELWSKVLHLNNAFTPAYLGLGKAAYKKGDYKLAMAYFEQGGYKSGYSQAFWQLRLQWFQSRFSDFATAGIIILVGLWLANKLSKRFSWRKNRRNRKRSENPFIVQFKHLFYIIRHPLDGFTAIRYENKGSYMSGVIILGLVFGAWAISNRYTSFTFNTVDIYRFNPIILFIQFMALWLGWVICNYLVSSIYRGEGRFKDVFIASSYALLPIILVGLPLALLSNVLTFSEISIYSFLRNGMMVWIVLLFFWSIQALQNYSVWETIGNIFWSLFAFTILIILVLIVFGLSSDLRSFIIEIYQEARLR